MAVHVVKPEDLRICHSAWPRRLRARAANIGFAGTRRSSLDVVIRRADP
jgi:hypothetical protein